MKPYTRKASVLWLGTRQRGKSAISTPSDVLKKAPYASGSDIKRRGTNPPELIAAAHAGSFSITLANELGEAGYRPRQIDTTATVTMEDRQIEETTSEYDKEKLQERLAKLAGGVAVINVGAATETEMKEKKARVEDALHATRAAVEEGIVLGGGVALIRCLSVLEGLKLQDGDEQIGVNIVKRAIEEPTRVLAANAGVEGSIVVQEVKRRKGNEGYNVATNEYEDLVKAGVVDPKKVTRAALQNAASIAGLLLTTECIIAEAPKKGGFCVNRLELHAACDEAASPPTDMTKFFAILTAGLALFMGGTLVTRSN